MKIKEVSVNVSKKIGQPKFGSAMASASIVTTVDDEKEVGTAFLESWAMAWEEVNKQIKEFETEEEIAESVSEDPPWIGKPTGETPPPPPQTASTTSAPTCPVHNIPKVWKPAGVSKTTGKAYPGFYACPAKNPDGTYCKN